MHLYLTCCHCEKKEHIWTSLLEGLNFSIQLLCVALASQFSFTLLFRAGRDGLIALPRVGTWVSLGQIFCIVSAKHLGREDGEERPFCPPACSFIQVPQQKKKLDIKGRFISLSNGASVLSKADMSQHFPPPCSVFCCLNVILLIELVLYSLLPV